MKNKPERNRKYYPLTHAQKRIYYDDKLYPGTSVSTQAFIVRYSRKLNRGLLEQAINYVIKKNEGFRLRIVELDYIPHQYVVEYTEQSLDYIEFTGPDSEIHLREWIGRTTQKPIEIIDSALYYFALIDFNERESGYYMKFHHVASDGGSYPLIFSEINKIYEALEADNEIDDTLNPSYLQYIEDEQTYLKSNQVENDKKFWHEYLLPLPSHLNLSAKKGDPASLKGNVFITTFPDPLRSEIDQYCKKTRTSLFKLLFTTISIYAARLSGLDDVAIAAVNHNRVQNNRQSVIGMFVSTLPFRVKIDGNTTFEELLTHTGKDVINHVLKNHQQYPFDRLASELRDATGIEANYLIDILISAHGDVDKEDYIFEHIFQGYVPGSINIHINYNNKYIDGILELEYEYRINHYAQSEIVHFHHGLVALLQEALSAPNTKISEIALMPEDEKRQILYTFSQGEPVHIEAQTINHLFEAQVEKYSGNTALTFRNQILTYREVNEKANQLARVLKAKGLKNGSLVGLLAQRSFKIPIGIIAVLKAGGIYVPLAPEDSIEHINYILEDSQCTFLLTDSHLTQSIVFNGEIINLEEESLYHGKIENLETINRPEDPVYVYYTGGFTGIWKGVVVNHSAFCNVLHGMQKKYPFEATDSILLKTSFYSGVAVLESLGWILGGGRLSILEPNGEKDPHIILNRIATDQITHIHFVPTLFRQFVNILTRENIPKLASLKYLFLSGETIIPETVSQFLRLRPNVKIENLYGSQETSVFTLSYPLSKWIGSGNIPIGKPSGNTNVYIVNFINRTPVLMPIGIPGELCVAGKSLAKGYLKNVQLSEEKFNPNPFGDLSDAAGSYPTLYRTGELARWLPDGNIEYLGGISQAIKIRGTRVDRSEIENYLLKQKDIKEAVVVARDDNSGIYLCAYFVADHEIDTSLIRNKFTEILPPHLVPAYFIQLEHIPLRPDGRIDRSELMDLKHDPHQIETILKEIEAEVLKLKRNEFDLDDHFISLGGHSLKAAEMAAKIHKALNVRISMTELFKRPTLRQLSEYLTESIEVKYASIQPAAPKEYYLQSSAQKRLYFLQQLDENDIVYNIQMMDIYCKGIEIEKLVSAFKALLNRHESLRTSFHLIDGSALQRIHDYDEVAQAFSIEYYETTEDGKIFKVDPNTKQPGEPLEGASFQDVIKGFVRPFDLSKPPLLRVGFIKIIGNTKILMLDMHHIISDGISMEILAKELWELYDEKVLPPLRIQYKDFSEWLNDKQSETKLEQETFWLNEFSGEIPLINLPIDYPRSQKMNFDGDIYQFEINSTNTAILNSIAIEHGESLYMVLFAAFNVLLNKISGQEDIVVGTVTAGRGHEDLRNIVGMFLNTLALRNYPEGEKSFSDFLTEVKLTAFSAFEHQDYPFEQLVSKVAPRQDTSRNPLFDVAFGLENEIDPTGYLLEVAIPDKSKPYDFAPHKSKFDMTLVCIDMQGNLECTLEYKTTLFKTTTINRISRYFQKIVHSVCKDIQQKIGEIEIISDEEKKEIIFDFNNTKITYPTDKTIHELFETCVEKTPDNIALSFKGKILTYHEVNQKANQLARVLRAKGVQPDHLVGIMVERCMEMIIGIIAIQKAGGAYLPIDPNYPEDRIRYLFKDSSGKLLLTLERFIEFAGKVEFDGEVMNLENPLLFQGDSTNISNINSPHNLAYIIYTSGSTGKPKGVMIEHIAAVNLLYTLDRMYPLQATDAYLLKTAFLFDVSVSEIFGWFWNGGKLAILEQGSEKDPLQIMEQVEKEKITHLNFVPSMFNVFVSMLDNDNIKKLATLRYIFLAGEAIWPESILKFRSFGTNVRIENLYGPTEATVYASWYPVAHWKGTGSVSIGKPVDNLKLYILSSDNKAKPSLQPIGIAGELTISGVQLARGYLNRPELTSQMFVNNPFAEAEGGDKNFLKLYHTGDLTRWYPDANIEYMGRIDHQVKVRGYRIELGEIESRLLDLEEIKEAIVIVREDKSGEKYLCAYLMSDLRLDMTSVRERLSKEIPNYMVPSYFVQIEKIPLNPNGKLDRKALPEPEAEAFTTQYAAPTNEMETILAEIWAEALGTKQVGIDDNFFEIGGDSIKTIMISAKLKKRQLSLNINDFFSHKTIRNLSKHIKKIERKIEQGPVSGIVELSPIHRWFFQKEFKEKNHFNHVVMLYRNDRFNENLVNIAFQKIVEHHDALRIVYEGEANKIIQKNRGLNEGQYFHLELINVKDKIHLSKEASRINKSIDLQSGPLVKLVIFRESSGDSLMIAIHQMLMDRFSWKILIDDFQYCYEQAEKNEEISLPLKTDSYKDWCEKLKEYADSNNALQELDYWMEVEEMNVGPMMKISSDKNNPQTYENQEIVSFDIDKNMTEKLLNDVNFPYNTDLKDILLTALALSLRDWKNTEATAIQLETTGRKMVLEDINISRTVGAFNSNFPLILDIKQHESGNDELPSIIGKIKETLRKVPNGGFGFSILKYLTSPQKRSTLTFNIKPKIKFNLSDQNE